MAVQSQVPCPYDLHPSVAHIQAIFANLERNSGRDLAAWVALARKAAPADLKGCAVWLKAQGLGGNQAGLVAQRACAGPGHAFDDTPEGYLAAAPGYVDAQYAGKRAALRPLFEAIVLRARSLGSDVKVCPCETIVPLYRHHVFAEVKPFASRLDLGLALGDPATVRDPFGRLKDTGGFPKKDRITHKLEITTEADLDGVQPWLRRAYERDVKA